MELRAGDRIRWTRNDASLGLVNSQTAEVRQCARSRCLGGRQRGAAKRRDGPASHSKDQEPAVPERGMGAVMDFGL